MRVPHENETWDQCFASNALILRNWEISQITQSIYYNEFAIDAGALPENDEDLCVWKKAYNKFIKRKMPIDQIQEIVKLRYCERITFGHITIYQTENCSIVITEASIHLYVKKILMCLGEVVLDKIRYYGENTTPISRDAFIDVVGSNFA